MSSFTHRLGRTRAAELDALARAKARLDTLPKEPFGQLDPGSGTGHIRLDLTEALPVFLKDGEHRKLGLPARGAWALDGDPTVEHYIDLATSDDLARVIGEDRFLELQAFGTALGKVVEENLPAEERCRMADADLRLVLDLAELRIADGTTPGTGHPVHIDWYPREGMVMIIPIVGNQTIIFPDSNGGPSPAGRVVGTLLTAFGRWQAFHGFDPTGLPESAIRQVKVGQTRQAVPTGMLKFLRTRAAEVPMDLNPDKPGVLPTVHRAGTGARTVIVLNFAYSAATSSTPQTF